MSFTESALIAYLKITYGASVLDTKWFHVLSAASVSILSVMAAMDWTAFVTRQEALVIVGGIATAKTFISALSAKDK